MTIKNLSSISFREKRRYDVGISYLGDRVFMTCAGLPRGAGRLREVGPERFTEEGEASASDLQSVRLYLQTDLLGRRGAAGRIQIRLGELEKVLLLETPTIGHPVQGRFLSRADFGLSTQSLEGGVTYRRDQ